MAALAKMVAIGVGSALVAYMFDPERGKGRRARAVDQAKSRMKRLQEAAERRVEYESNRLQGLKHELLSDDSPDHPDFEVPEEDPQGPESVDLKQRTTSTSGESA